MKTLLILNIVFVFAGIVLLAMAYRERNKDNAPFSFKLSAFRGIRNRFTQTGHRYYLAGVLFVSLGCLSSSIYWLSRSD
ncbi:MAG: hypothetical protein AB1483_13870 [Candidatus Zixiibacteriota bacterium]